MARYIVGSHEDDDALVILGIVDASDLGVATLAAQVRWAEAGCFPWESATEKQRERALLAVNYPGLKAGALAEKEGPNP